MESGDMSQVGVCFLPTDGAHSSHMGSHSLPQAARAGNPLQGHAGPRCRAVSACGVGPLRCVKRSVLEAGQPHP